MHVQGKLVGLIWPKPELWSYAMAQDNQYLLHNVEAYADLLKWLNWIKTGL